MSDTTIDDMNEVIANFDGWEFRKGNPDHKCNFCVAGDESCTPAVDRFVKGNQTIFHYELKYHSSWDWLMPVVLHIEGLESGRFGFTIDPWGVQVGDYKEEEETIVDVFRDDNQPRIEILYHAVYEFITWYNK